MMMDSVRPARCACSDVDEQIIQFVKEAHPDVLGMGVRGRGLLESCCVWLNHLPGTVGTMPSARGPYLNR